MSAADAAEDSARTSRTTVANRRGGRRGSSVDRLFKSRDVQMTTSDERVGLRGTCACTVRISREEVSDFCSVLSLADRVFVAGSADAMTVAALFRLSVYEFGSDAHVPDSTTVRHVEPTDTVVVIAGPRPDAALTDIVRDRGRHPGGVAGRCDASDSAAAPARRCRHNGPVDRRNGVHGGKDPPRRSSTSCHSSRSMPFAGTSLYGAAATVHADPPSRIPPTPADHLSAPIPHLTHSSRKHHLKPIVSTRQFPLRTEEIP